MLKNKIILSALVIGSLSNINADFLGAEAGVAMWTPNLTGTIKGGSSTSIDMEEDLGYNDSSNNIYMWAYFDHFVPLIPNIKVQQTNYSADANKNTSVTFLGNTYNNVNTKSELTLNQTDIIAYWRILDNWVNFDIGIDVKSINGNIKLESAGLTTTDKDFSITVPMGYVKARIDLPFTGLSVEADMAKIAYGDNSFTDMKAGLVYETSLGLGAVAGIRSETLKIDDVSDVSANIEISGAYAGIYYHF